MTVKGLIENLLEMPMDSEINVAVQNEEGEFVYYNTEIPVFHERYNTTDITAIIESKFDIESREDGID